jgi:hypothetical protein
MDAAPRRYRAVPPRKAAGASYTPPGLARFVADRIVAALPPPPGRPLRVLDPAAGDGALLLALGEALRAAGRDRFVLHAVEQDADAAARAEARLRAAFPGCRVEVRHGDFLAEVPALPGCGEAERYEVIIANPPYVRTQVLGASVAQALARRFGLRGIDLYQAFLLALPERLAAEGALGIILSNRFLSTRAGATLRARLPERLRLVHVWDLGDTRLFADAVLPAVVVARGRGPAVLPAPCGFSSIYAEPGSEGAPAADALAAIGGPAGARSLPDGRRFRVRHGGLDRGEPGAVWRLSEPAGDAWLSAVAAATWRTFGGVGKVRVGVKTTADSVFIRDDWHHLPPSARPELLRTLTTHHGARRYTAPVATTRMIVYPHLADGDRRVVADLADFPRTAAYLEVHRGALAGRPYVIAAGRAWYELWVPQDPRLWPRPKLVFRDITDRPVFWIDAAGTVVNGDCYWLVVDPAVARDAPGEAAGLDLLRLAAAVGNSTFVEQFYDRVFPNKLYGGRRRFISQYVERFPLPDPASDTARAIVRLVEALPDGLGADRMAAEGVIDALVWAAFGVPRDV